MKRCPVIGRMLNARVARRRRKLLLCILCLILVAKRLVWRPVVRLVAVVLLTIRLRVCRIVCKVRVNVRRKWCW